MIFYILEQVDILISKNQSLQILVIRTLNIMYIYKTSQLRNLTKSMRPYIWSALLAASCLNIGYMSLYELIRICNKGPHSNAYNIVLNTKWLYSLASS